MKLTRFTLGQVVSIGIASVAFILLVKFFGLRWDIPVLSTIARQV